MWPHAGTAFRRATTRYCSTRRASTTPGHSAGTVAVGKPIEDLLEAFREGSDVGDRVTFHERDAADAELAGRYDLVTIFEALHDMSFPVDVLRAVRGLLAEGGSVFIGDERTEDSFQAPASDLERLYYGFSTLHCLPVGMIGDNPAGTGTVMRTDTVRGTRTRRGSPALRYCRSRTTSGAFTA